MTLLNRCPPRRHRFRRTPSYPRALGAAAALVVVACGGPAQQGAAGDAGPGCPTTVPHAGDSCAVPGDTGCRFGYSCEEAWCEDGHWRIGLDPNVASCRGDPLPPSHDCPGTQPPVGTSCGPEGYGFCNYPDSCRIGFDRYMCSQGRWVIFDAGYTAECPVELPVAGKSCGPCAQHLPASCEYDRCAQPDGGLVSFYCNPSSENWNELNVRACDGGVDGSSTDGGPDAGDTGDALAEPD